MYVICVCCCSPGDVKELEKAIVSMVRAENADIKQKSDPARLQIQHCQLVVVHTHPSPPTAGAPSSSSEVKDCPLSQVGACMRVCNINLIPTLRALLCALCACVLAGVELRT